MTKEVARSAGGQVSIGFDTDDGTHLDGTAQTGGEHQRFVREDNERYAAAVKAAGIKAE